MYQQQPLEDVNRLCNLFFCCNHIHVYVYYIVYCTCPSHQSWIHLIPLSIKSWFLQAEILLCSVNFLLLFFAESSCITVPSGFRPSSSLAVSVLSAGATASSSINMVFIPCWFCSSLCSDIVLTKFSKLFNFIHQVVWCDCFKSKKGCKQ